MLLPLLLSLSCLAQATEYTDRASWEAAAGPSSTANFTGFADGTPITNQYSSLGMLFTQGNDTVLSTGAFVVDGKGVQCNGDMEIQFAAPVSSIGADFPGALQITLYSGASLVYSSSNFAGSGSGFFAGLVSSTPFDRAVIKDWFDQQAYVDNVSVGGASGLTLAMQGSCPGAVTASVTGATPGGSVAVVLAATPGAFVIPSGSCAGTALGLGSGISLVTVITANSNGEASLSGNLPPALCGRLLQVVDLSSCDTSNVVTL